jgi:hypothetical protein
LVEHRSVIMRDREHQLWHQAPVSLDGARIITSIAVQVTKWASRSIRDIQAPRHVEATLRPISPKGGTLLPVATMAFAD